MHVIKRKDAGRYECITGANGAGKQRQIRGRHRPRQPGWPMARHRRDASNNMKMPVVRKEGSRFCVEIAPGAVISWEFRPGREGTITVLTVHAPGLKTWADIDEAHDRLTFPVEVLQ